MSSFISDLTTSNIHVINLAIEIKSADNIIPVPKFNIGGLLINVSKCVIEVDNHLYTFEIMNNLCGRDTSLIGGWKHT